jgi:hypothetical protein
MAWNTAFPLRSRSFWVVQCAAALAFALCVPCLRAGVEVPQELFRESMAVCRATILGGESFRDSTGLLQTRTFVRVEERFKGRFPTLLTLVHPGGFDGQRGVQWGHDPLLRPGEERLLFLSRRPDGTLRCTTGAGSAIRLRQAGPALANAQVIHPVLLVVRACAAGAPESPESDVTDQGVLAPYLASEGDFLPPPPLSGLMTDASGLSSRFIASDRGQAIPYLVDVSTLPTGMSVEQALGAVRTALAAWSAVTPFTFEFEGFEDFGAAASNIEASDGRIRIQLHDRHGAIPAASVLGIGGRAYHSSGNPANTWGKGGAVAGVEFHQSVSGFVVMSHVNPSARNLSTFTETLCHEIGHVLSLAHSSENPFEADARLREAMMYYAAHGDGRGARLTEYDQSILLQVAPRGNTPPFSYDRIIDAVTQSGAALNIAGMNEVEAVGYDLQSAQVVFQSALPTSDNGSFSVTGTRVRFTPAGFFAAPRIENLESSEAYDRIYVRHFDGTNASAYATIRVVSFQRDQNRDGVPDEWTRSYFPNGGATAAASADPDRDGFTNLREYQLGSNPAQATSNFRIVSIDSQEMRFQAKPYEVYEVHGSVDGIVFQREYAPTVALVPETVFPRYRLEGRPYRLLRVVKVP